MATAERFARFGESRDFQGGADTDNFEDHHTGLEQASMLQPIPEDNIGHRLLLKQGWQAGQGLGKQLQGRTEPIPIIIKEELMGFGRMEMELGQAGETTERRRILECEKENTEELQLRYKENQEKEKAKEESLADLKSSFYCQLCEKQYLKHTDYDNHINSYDHAHKQRLKDLNKREFGRHVGAKRYKEEKKREKEMKRITEFAESRVQNTSEGNEGAQGDSPNSPKETQPNSSPVDQHSPAKSGPDSDESPQKAGTTVSFSISKKSTAKRNLAQSSAIFKEENKEDAPEVEQAADESTNPANADNQASPCNAAGEKEAYHNSVPAHCKVKPKFDFLRFVKPGEESKATPEGDGADNSPKANPKPTGNGSPENADIKDSQEDTSGPTPDKSGSQGPEKKQLLCFLTVKSLEDKELEWPNEMVQYTKTEPSISYSCNPLYFDFAQLMSKPKVEPPVKMENENAVVGAPTQPQEKETEAPKDQITTAGEESQQAAEIGNGQVEDPAKVAPEEETKAEEDKKETPHKKKKKKKSRHRSRSTHVESDKENAEEDGEHKKSKHKKKKKKRRKRKRSEKEKEPPAADGEPVADGEPEKNPAEKTPKKHKKKKKHRKHKKSKHSDNESPAASENEMATEEKVDEAAGTGKEGEAETAATAATPPVAKQEKQKSKSKKRKKSKKSKKAKKAKQHSEEESESEEEKDASEESSEEAEPEGEKVKKSKKTKKKKKRRKHVSSPEAETEESSEDEAEAGADGTVGVVTKKPKRKYRKKVKESDSSDESDSPQKKTPKKKSKSSKRKAEDQDTPAKVKGKRMKVNSISSDTAPPEKADEATTAKAVEAKAKPAQDKAQLKKEVSQEATAQKASNSQSEKPTKVKSEKMSDFEAEEDFTDGKQPSTAGKCKWDTSSDSELETMIKEATNKGTESIRSQGSVSRGGVKGESERSQKVSKEEDKSERKSQKESESQRSKKPEEEESRARERSKSHHSHRSDSDSDYHRRSRSRSRHRSRSDDSYSDSDDEYRKSRRRRGRSYSSDSDYDRRRSRRSRSHSSYSYSRSRSRSRYRSRRRRDDSYSSYSDDSRHHSRSRSRSYRSYSRDRGRKRSRYYSRSYSSSDSSYYRSRSRSRRSSRSRSRHRTRSISRDRSKPSPDRFKSLLNKKDATRRGRAGVEKRAYGTDQTRAPAAFSGNKEDNLSQAAELIKKVRGNSPSQKGIAETDKAAKGKGNGSEDDEEQKIALAKQREEEATAAEAKIQAENASMADDIPLPENGSFIGPVLPSNHPLAHTQDIPLPEDGTTDESGPNSQFKAPSKSGKNANPGNPRTPGNAQSTKLPPPPPPPNALTAGPPAKRMRGGPTPGGSTGKPPLPPPPMSPPPLPPQPSKEQQEAEDKKRRDAEDQMKAAEEARKKEENPEPMPPPLALTAEQAEQYKALQVQAKIHVERMKLKEQRDLGLIPDEDSDEEAAAVSPVELLDPQPIASPVIAASPILLQGAQPIALPHPLASPQPQIAQRIPINMVPVSLGHPGLVQHQQLSALPAGVSIASIPQAGAPMIVAQSPIGNHLPSGLIPAGAVHAGSTPGLPPGAIPIGVPSGATLTPFGQHVAGLHGHPSLHAGLQPQPMSVQMPGAMAGVPAAMAGAAGHTMIPVSAGSLQHLAQVRAAHPLGIPLAAASQPQLISHAALAQLQAQGAMPTLAGHPPGTRIVVGPRPVLLPGTVRLPHM